VDRADLRNLADTPERAAEIHVNEGVCEVFDVVFPPKGTLITPVWPARHQCALLRAPALPSACWPASSPQAVNGRIPAADQETIRYTGFFGNDLDGTPFLSREVIGGGSGGRYYADGNDAIHIVPDFAQPARGVHRNALPGAGGKARPRHRLRRRRHAPRRARLRQHYPRAGRLP